MAFDFFKKRSGEANTVETKASATGPVIAYHGAGRVAWSARDTVSLTRSGFAGNPVGFRAVTLIAEAAAAVPLVLQNSEQRFETHAFLQLLAAPNAAQGQVEFFEALFGQLLLSGDAYVEAVASETDAAFELHVLRSDRMKVVPGADGWPIAYEYAVGARKHRFDLSRDVAPICHIKSFHPQDDHYGLSPMQAAATALDVHNSASRWSKALLDNAARPSGAIVVKGTDGSGPFGAEQLQRLQDEMAAYHQGAKNAGRPMLLEGGLDWKPMGFSPSDMEFQKTKESAAREIAIAFGVPPMLLGIPGDATYANYQEANRAFYRQVVVPLAGKVAGKIGDWLAGYTGEVLDLKPDLDQIAALASERDAQWSRVAGADFLSAEEKRALLGLPPLSVEADG